MMEIIGTILTYIMFIPLIILGAYGMSAVIFCGIFAVVKLDFIVLEVTDKITDKLKKKVRN